MTSIILSQTAPWNSRLTNPYRTRWTEVDGRYFRIAAESLNDMWTIDEVNADGTLAGHVENGEWVGFLESVFTLAEARAKITAETTR